MKRLLKYKQFESVINRKKEDQIFNYNSIINSAWNPIIQAAKKFQDIYFDLENNDSMNEKKTIYIPKNLRKDQPIKYEFNAELYAAGGDWEWPVMYFKVEFTSSYGIRDEKKKEYIFDLKKEYTGLSNCYVFIPDNDNGNHLVKTDKGLRAYQDEDFNDTIKDKDVKITDSDKKKAWKWLEELLTEVVDKRHKMLDD